MSLYASYVGANSPNEKRNPEQCEEPLFRKRHESQHEEGTKEYAEVWTYPELIRTRALILYVKR